MSIVNERAVPRSHEDVTSTAAGSLLGDDGSLTRREILARGGALAAVPSLAALLAACGGSGGSSDQLDVLLWEGTFEQSFPAFSKKTGIKVRDTFQTDPIQSANLLKASPGSYDIIGYGPFDSPDVWEGLMQPIDVSKVKYAYDMQYPYFREMWNPKVFAPVSYRNHVYGIVFELTSTVLAWNTEKVKPAPNSWDVMIDPEYAGKTSFNDQAAEMFGTLSRASGLSVNGFTPKQFNTVTELGKKWFANAKTLWSTGTDVQEYMAQGDVWVAHVWDGIARSLVKSGYPIAYTYPVQGVRGAICGPGLIKGAGDPDGAYKLMNFIMQPDVGAYAATHTLYTPSNIQAVKACDKETQELLAFDKMTHLLSTGGLELQKPNLADFSTLNKWWTNMKIQAGVG